MTIELRRTPIIWPARCVNCWREAAVFLSVASSYALVTPIDGVPFCSDCAAASQAVRRRTVLAIAIGFVGLMLAALAIISLAPERERHAPAIIAIDVASVMWCVLIVLITWVSLRHEARAAGRVSIMAPLKVVRNDSSGPRIVLVVKRREVVDYLLEHNDAREVSTLVI